MATNKYIAKTHAEPRHIQAKMGIPHHCGSTLATIIIPPSKLSDINIIPMTIRLTPLRKMALKDRALIRRWLSVKFPVRNKRTRARISSGSFSTSRAKDSTLCFPFLNIASGESRSIIILRAKGLILSIILRSGYNWRPIPSINEMPRIN